MIDVDTLARIAQIKDLVRDMPDFPKAGVVFKDIMPLLKHGPAFNNAIQYMADSLQASLGFQPPTSVIGVESRGFIIGAALAHNLGVGFVPARKAGKLPGWIVKQEYSLEYGKDAIEIQGDALLQGDRVVICDDVLATGGTAEAVTKLVTRLGGVVVASCFLVELTKLQGRSRLKNVNSILQY